MPAFIVVPSRRRRRLRDPVPIHETACGESVCSAASLGTSRRQLWGNPSRQTNRRQRRIGLRGRWEDTTAPASDDESRRAVRLDTKGVVDGATQLLLAPEVPLRRLDRDVPEGGTESDPVHRRRDDTGAHTSVVGREARVARPLLSAPHPVRAPTTLCPSSRRPRRGRPC